ncbi:MAG: hypothetical protein AAGA81_07200 [Acidobacteriota bacterium]
MRKVLPALAGLTLLLGTVVACGPSEEEIQAQARADEYTALQEQRDALAALRAEATAIEEKIAQGAEALELDEDGFAALETELSGKLDDVNSAADDFSNTVVQFINSGVDQDATETEEFKAAISMKSGEDILLARDYIARGGDYRRAIQIVEQQLQFDPENADLQAAMDEFSDWRYINRARFDALKKGMTEQEVRDTVGIPFHRNIRDYPEQNSVGWFYQKDDEGEDAGGPSAIFFRESGGEMKVSQLQWEVKS